MNSINEETSTRPVIFYTLIIALGLSAFPWFGGGQEGMIRFVVAGLLLLAAILAWRQSRLRRLSFGPLAVSYFGFVGWMALSLVWSVNRYESVMWLTQLILAGVVFRLTYAISDEPKVRNKIENAYLAGAVIFVIYALFLYLTGAYDRLTGWFYWANPAGAFLIPAIIILWGRLKWQSRRRIVNWRWFVFSLVSLILAAFFLADSRGAMLVIAILFIPIMFLQSHNKYSRTLLVLSLLVGFLLSLGFVQLRHITSHGGAASAPGSRFAEAASGESRSMKDRLNYLKSAADIWYGHPLLGTGGGTFATVHPKYQRTVVSASTSAHNIYAQTLAEAGIVGGMLLAGFVLVLGSGLIRTLWRDPARASVSLGAIALLAHFGLDIDVRYPALVFLAAVLAGVSFQQKRDSYSKLSLTVPVVMLLAFVVLMSSFQSGVAYVRGLASQSDSDFQTASAWFEQAHSGLTYDPDTINAEGIDYYSEAILGAEGASALALDRARLAIRQDPEDSQHYQLEGRVLQLQKDLSGAENAFTLALIKDPYNHPDYASDLALVQIKAGKPHDALETVESMLAKYPAAVIENRNADSALKNNLANLDGILAQLRMNSGDITGAKTAVSDGLKLSPDNLRCRALQNVLNAR